MKKTTKKGFTIVELVIVIAVIAILAAVLIPTFSNVVDKANRSSALQAARNEYTTLLSDIMADGKLDTAETSNSDKATVSTDKTTITVSSANFTYTFKNNTKAELTGVSANDNGAYRDYTFTVTNGEIKISETSSTATTAATGEGESGGGRH